jgi:hypothetical protein
MFFWKENPHCCMWMLNRHPWNPSGLPTSCVEPQPLAQPQNLHKPKSTIPLNMFIPSTLAQPQNLRKPKSIPLNLFIPSTLSFSFCIWLPLVQDLHFSLTLGKDTHKDGTKSQCDIYVHPTCFSNVENPLQNFHVLPCKVPKNWQTIKYKKKFDSCIWLYMINII